MKKQKPTLLVSVDVKGKTQKEAEDIGANVFYSIIGEISYKEDCEYIASGVDVISSWAGYEEDLKPIITIDMVWQRISNARAFDIANAIRTWMNEYLHEYVDTTVEQEPGTLRIVYENAKLRGNNETDF